MRTITFIFLVLVLFMLSATSKLIGCNAPDKRPALIKQIPGSANKLSKQTTFIRFKGNHTAAKAFI